MPKTEDVVRLGHMRDAATKVMEYVSGCARDDLDRDEKLTLAIVRLLEILGEAGKNVSKECQAQYPHMPWRQIAGTRDRLIHGYFDVDLDVVGEIATSDLPVLAGALDKALGGGED